MALAMYPRGLTLPWLLAHYRIIFPNKGFFQKKIFFLSQWWLFGQASMPWPRQHAYRHCPGPCCLPIGDAMILDACLCPGCLPIG